MIDRQTWWYDRANLSIPSGNLSVCELENHNFQRGFIIELFLGHGFHSYLCQTTGRCPKITWLFFSCISTCPFNGISIYITIQPQWLSFLILRRLLFFTLQQTKIAMGNGPFSSMIYPLKSWFSIAMLTFQRVIPANCGLCEILHQLVDGLSAITLYWDSNLPTVDVIQPYIQ